MEKSFHVGSGPWDQAKVEKLKENRKIDHKEKEMEQKYFVGTIQHLYRGARKLHGKE